MRFASTRSTLDLREDASHAPLHLSVAAVVVFTLVLSMWSPTRARHALAGTRFDDRQSIQMRTADGPEQPEWFPILGDVRVGCTTGNPNSEGVVDDSCHQDSSTAGGEIAYHPWPAIDLHTPDGAVTRASGAGTVISVGHTTAVPEDDPLEADASNESLAARAGGWVVIAHADGPNSVYKHAGEWLVAPGDHVEPGQVIGMVAYPATRTPHLHYDEQDPDARFNAPEARVTFETMLSRDWRGQIVTYPEAAGARDWNEVNQATVIGSDGWRYETAVTSEAELRAAVAGYGASDRDGPFTIELLADITLTGGPLDYDGDELLMLDGDADLDGQRRRLTPSAGSRLLDAPDHDAALELRGMEVVGRGPVDEDGGLLRAAGAVTIVNTDLSGGRATGDGGAISSEEWVTLVRSEIFDNSAGGDGGAVRATRVAVVDSTVHHNSAGEDGGGLSTTDAPLSGEHIGGDHAQTDVNRVSNSTVSLNRAGSAGGGIATDGDLYVQNSTIHGNTSTSDSDSVAAAGRLTAAATAFSASPGRSNCRSGVTRSLGGSLDSGDNCDLNGPFDVENESARLGALRLNGGAIPTHYPLAGSPLVDAFAELPDSATGRFDDAPPCSPTGRVADQRSSGPLDPLPGRSYKGLRFDYPDPSHAGLDGICDIGAVASVYPGHDYADVPAWLEAATRWISSDDRDAPRIMGDDSGAFNPINAIIREELANALYGFAGRPDVGRLPGHAFTDVAPWADPAVSWVTYDPPSPEPPSMAGYGDGTYRGEDTVTRGQFVRALHRITGGATTADPVAKSASLADVPTWLEASVRWITADPDGDGPLEPVMSGYADGTFRADLDVTRAQVTQTLYQLALTPEMWRADDGTPVEPDSSPGRSFPPGAFWAPL